MKTRFITILSLFALTTFFVWYLSRRDRTQTTSQSINTMVVGTNAEFAPFSFIEQDEIVGFDIDIIKEVARRLGKKITFKNMSFAALIPEIQLGTIQVIAAGMTPTPERAKRVLFTKPYFDHDPLIMIQPAEATRIENPEQLAGKSIIVNQGYSADRHASTIANADIIRLSSPLVSTGIMALKSGKGDLYISSLSSINPYIEKHGKHGFTFTPLDQAQESYAAAVSKKYPKLYDDIQKVLDEMQQDGTLATIRKKWNL